MSHAYGLVRFPDGLIKHFEYNGTVNVCQPKLYDSSKEVEKNWRFDTEIECTCGNKPESVEIFTYYSSGYTQNGSACRICNCLVNGLDFEDARKHKPQWVIVYECKESI